MAVFLCSTAEYLYAFVGSFWQFFMLSNNLGNFEKNHSPQICLIRNPNPIKKFKKGPKSLKKKVHFCKKKIVNVQKLKKKYLTILKY